MKKYFLPIACLLVILQLLLYRSNRSHVINAIKTSNLTYLMMSFEDFNQNSTVLCSENTLRQQYDQEFNQLQSFQLNQVYELSEIRPQLPYFYSLWKTSSLLPRLMTPCEHRTYIELLIAFDRICRIHQIEYLISHGTLLGSYRNHDILPYDDDVDILIHQKYYSHLSTLNQTEWKFHLQTSINMKFFFRNSPSAGRYPWKWPFIGIQFYTDNSTHIYLNQHIPKNLIFPLILRPISTLWLPTPRYVHAYLRSLQKDYFINYPIDKKCMMKNYSHRNEKHLSKSKIVDCEQLYNIYPFIRRICDETHCYEYLMINTCMTLYILKTEKNRY